MNIVVTERDKKLLRLVVCLAIIVTFADTRMHWPL